jgi:putative FmdB family regulatory protein
MLGCPRGDSVMPIYAYRCSSCGHAKDVLQKISDPLLTVCPSCGAATFQKQLTAAGFQLKGSGWYVTDFRGGEKAGDGANSGVATAPKTDATPAAPAPAAAGAPAASGSAASAPAPSASKSPSPSVSSSVSPPATKSPSPPAAPASSPSSAT